MSRLIDTADVAYSGQRKFLKNLKQNTQKKVSGRSTCFLIQ